MLETRPPISKLRLSAFFIGGSLAFPFLLLMSGTLDAIPLQASLALGALNALALAALAAFLASQSSKAKEKYQRIVHLAFFPWLIASLGAAIGSMQIVRHGILNDTVTILQFDVALNFCLSLTLFVLFATMQIRERHPLSFRNWIAPLILFFVLGILQFVNFRQGVALGSFSTVAGVSSLVAALNAAIAWQLSGSWQAKARLSFLLAIGLQLVAHCSILSQGHDSMAIAVFRDLTGTTVIALLFAFHRQLGFVSNGAFINFPSLKRVNASLAEEIAGPLQTVIAYGDLLRTELASSMQFSASMEVEKINQAAFQMLSLIDPSQRKLLPHPIEQNSFDSERFVNVLHRMAERMAAPFGTEIQSFCPRGFGIILGDEMKLLQICSSTLDFVLRSGKQSKLSIHLYPLQSGGQDFINIDIRGTGPGLERNLAQVLEAGFIGRLNLYSGLGSPFGLLRIKDLCESMSVRFWLETCEGRGSTFSISYPDKARRSVFVRRKELSTASVLLIDGDSQAERMLKDMVVGGEFDLVRVSQMRSGLRVFYEKQPEIVIADLTSPDLQGLHFIESVRSQKSTCYIISLVSKEGEISGDQALRLGADLLLEKPLSLEGLKKGLGSLDTVLRRTA